MERFIKGDVVAVPFPFSDLSEFKRRFALVVAEITGDDVILCQITSQLFSDEYSISIDNQDFTGGSILHPSDIRRKNYLL